MSKLSAALANFNLATPVQSLEGGLHNLVASYMKPANAAAMEPELTNGVNSAVGLLLKFLKVYAYAKVEGQLKEFLTSLAAKMPAAAPEIQALIAKLPA